MLIAGQDTDDLGEVGDFAILNADDGEQFEDDNQEKCADAQQDERVVLDVHPSGEIADRIRPECQRDEGEADEKEGQGVAFFEPVVAKSPHGQHQQAQANGGQDYFEIHRILPLLWPT